MTYAFQIKWLDEVDSTNNEIARCLDDLDNLSVLSARNQFAGRGQRGNKWNTSPGENLTFSLLVRPGQDGIPAVRATDQFRLSQVATLSVYDLLSSHGVNCTIKWPNDIYVGNRKICGMLIENSLSGQMIASSIIGIGLNVNQKEFDPSLVNPTSMKAITGESFSTDTLLEEFCGFFGRRIPSLESPDSLKEEYLSHLYRKDTFHDYTDCRKGEIFRGKIIDVDNGGMLSVEDELGNVNKFSFKEISYII